MCIKPGTNTGDKFWLCSKRISSWVAAKVHAQLVVAVIPWEKACFLYVGGGKRMAWPRGDVRGGDFASAHYLLTPYTLLLLDPFSHSPLTKASKAKLGDNEKAADIAASCSAIGRPYGCGALIGWEPPRTAALWLTHHPRPSLAPPTPRSFFTDRGVVQV